MLGLGLLNACIGYYIGIAVLIAEAMVVVVAEIKAQPISHTILLHYVAIAMAIAIVLFDIDIIVKPHITIFKTCFVVELQIVDDLNFSIYFETYPVEEHHSVIFLMEHTGFVLRSYAILRALQ